MEALPSGDGGSRRPEERGRKIQIWGGEKKIPGGKKEGEYVRRGPKQPSSTGKKGADLLTSIKVRDLERRTDANLINVFQKEAFQSY